MAFVEEQLEVMGRSFPAPDSTGQKVEQAHHLQQTEEESEEEKSSGQSITPGIGVSVQRSIFIKWVWQNE